MEKKIVVTHSGSFHADEVFAVATLKLMLGNDFDLEVVRSRDPEDWARGDYVVDVGGIYDPSKQRFDHHQEGGAGSREDGIDYSSMGLVWKEYGEIVCGSKEVSDLIDRDFVRPIDAADNGQEISTPVYKDLVEYTLGSVISEFRPSVGESGLTYDEGFQNALRFAVVLLERVIMHAHGQVEGEKKIREMVEKQLEENPEAKVVEIDHNYPWKRVLITEYPNLLYVIYQDTTEKWRLKAINKSLGSFEYRKFLPESWAGKNNEELAEVTGVSDAYFCHRHLFTCGAGSKEGVLALAKIAIEA